MIEGNKYIWTFYAKSIIIEGERFNDTKIA
jgi:hypothetical protein